jgi:GT2 family glycosyltransferase
LHGHGKHFMNRHGVSIIIPNYNGESLLKENLPAVLEAGEAYAGSCEVIVVDDASRDRSVDLIASHFPSVRLAEQKTNQGFAGTIHTGVRNAAHEYIILLNSDVRPERDFIGPLIANFQDPGIFSVSPLICDPDGTPQTVSWNLGMIKRGNISFRSWSLEEALERAGKGQPLKSLFASGGSVALRKSMFLQLGGFLSLYQPFYYEDVDLCTRAWIKGWQTLFEPQSRVIHDHAGVIRLHFDARRVRIIRLRNRFFYLWLHLSRKKILFSHVPGIVYRLLFRSLQLDMTYMTALLLAGARLKELMTIRAQMKSNLEAVKPLEKILTDITQII